MDFVGTVWALLPPVIAIVLALITKEVYMSLFIGVVTGALLYTNFSPVGTIEAIFEVMMEKLGDSWNVGILIFLVFLGIIVALMTRAGGSAAYGKWAGNKIKTRSGALLSTFALGVVIFVDDYFNCLTVGNVMRPVTDKQKISRAKLAYIIDATAAPICIIAPISSWAAAVTGYTNGDGFSLFLQTIPFNLYAWLTILMVIFMGVTGLDYGPMKKFEENAAKGDLFSGKNDYFRKRKGDRPCSSGHFPDCELHYLHDLYRWILRGRELHQRFCKLRCIHGTCDGFLHYISLCVFAVPATPRDHIQ